IASSDDDDQGVGKAAQLEVRGGADEPTVDPDRQLALVEDLVGGGAPLEDPRMRDVAAGALPSAGCPDLAGGHPPVADVEESVVRMGAGAEVRAGQVRSVHGDHRA